MATIMLSEALVRPRVFSLPSSSASSPRPLLFSSFRSTSLRYCGKARVALVLRRKLPSRIPARSTSLTANASTPRNGVYTVGDFMTKKENLHVVKSATGVDEALELLVEKRITGFPVIDDDWKLVGVVSDYDLLALDSISGGGGRAETNLFPEVNSSWKILSWLEKKLNVASIEPRVPEESSGIYIDTERDWTKIFMNLPLTDMTFNKIQKLLSKTNGQVVGDVMTPAPLVVREATNLEDAARLLLETKYRRLPVVDSNGKLVGMITRGNVVRAALQLKHESENIN